MHLAYGDKFNHIHKFNYHTPFCSACMIVIANAVYMFSHMHRDAENWGSHALK